MTAWTVAVALYLLGGAMAWLIIAFYLDKRSGRGEPPPGRVQLAVVQALMMTLWPLFPPVIIAMMVWNWRSEEMNER